MPTQLLPIGPAVAITQNTVYALPTQLVFLTSTIAVETSVDGTTWTPLANATTGVITGAAFVRCTVGNATVICKDASRTSIGGSNPVADLTANTLALGTNPALSGILRLPNSQYIRGRNAANNADINLIRVDPTNLIEIGAVGSQVGISGSFICTNGIIIQPGAPAIVQSFLQIEGTAYIAIAKRTVRPTPGSSAILFTEDNGSGKMRTMIQYPTGAPVQVSIEP